MLFANAIQIDEELVSSMLKSWENDNQSIPEKQFWCYWEDGDKHGYTVIDNRGYDFLMEDFKTPEAAHAWLRGLYVAFCYEIDKMIAEVEEAEALAVELADKRREESIYDDCM